MKFEPIIELVESICRDSADTQYMLIKTNFSKSPKQLKLWAVITPHRSSSSVFMMNNTPSGAKMNRESTKPESRQMAKMFSFFFFFVFFRWASSNLHDSFYDDFAQNSSIFHWAVHQPIAFFQVWSHTRRFEPLTEELWLFCDAIFLHVYACTQIT